MPTGSTTSNPSRERDGVGRDLTKSGSEFREDVIGAKCTKEEVCVYTPVALFALLIATSYF